MKACDESMRRKHATKACDESLSGPDSGESGPDQSSDTFSSVFSCTASRGPRAAVQERLARRALPADGRTKRQPRATYRKQTARDVATVRNRCILQEPVASGLAQLEPLDPGSSALYQTRDPSNECLL